MKHATEGKVTGGKENGDVLLSRRNGKEATLC